MQLVCTAFAFVRRERGRERALFVVVRHCRKKVGSLDLYAANVCLIKIVGALSTDTEGYPVHTEANPG